MRANYFPKGGKYIARTDSDATLNVEQVCAARRDHHSFTGNFDDMVNYVRQFFDEAAYQLLNGFAVNMEYFSIHPNLGGTFDTAHETPDPEKHPLTYRFRPLKPMRELAQSAQVIVEGVADTDGYIDEFADETGAVNSLYVPGNIFTLHGHKIKAEGDDPGVGVYFVPVNDPGRAMKVSRIAENTASRITGIAPTIGYPASRIEVRTQYSGTEGRFLKNIRTITSDFTVEES